MARKTETNVPDYLRAAIGTRIKECDAKLDNLPGVKRPVNVTVKYNLRGKCAGRAITVPATGECTLRVNVVLATENFDDYIHNTVAHEYAHFVTGLTFGYVRAHGPQWQSIMRALGVNPTTYHNYNTAHAQVRKGATVPYTCECPGFVHQVGMRRHHNIVNCGRQFRCVKCRARIVQQSTEA